MKQQYLITTAALAMTFLGQVARAQNDEPMEAVQMDEMNAAPSQTPPDSVTFQLVPNPKVINCLRASPLVQPKATATLLRGARADFLTIRLENIKPGLQFDLFTVQHSPFLFDGKPDPNFHNSFGLAWYQTDLEASNTGGGAQTIHTILLDQIFGFDADTGLKPTNTFHVGFWFNNPEDARACGFDVTHPTPFNGEHKAGPVAMISLPKQFSKLGPLCTNPDFSTNPVTCHP